MLVNAPMLLSVNAHSDDYSFQEKGLLYEQNTKVCFQSKKLCSDILLKLYAYTVFK